MSLYWFSAGPRPSLTSLPTSRTADSPTPQKLDFNNTTREQVWPHLKQTFAEQTKSGYSKDIFTMTISD